MKNIKNILITISIVYLTSVYSHASSFQEDRFSIPRCGSIKTLAIGLLLMPHITESVPWSWYGMNPTSPTVSLPQKTRRPTCLPNPNFKPWTDKQGYVHTIPLQPLIAPCWTYSPTLFPTVTSSPTHHRPPSSAPSKMNIREEVDIEIPELG